MSIFKIKLLPLKDIMEKRIIIECKKCHREFPHLYTTPEKYNNLIAEWECLACGGRQFEVSIVEFKPYSAPRNTMLDRYLTR